MPTYAGHATRTESATVTGEVQYQTIGGAVRRNGAESSIQIEGAKPDDVQLGTVEEKDSAASIHMGVNAEKRIRESDAKLP